MIDHIVLDVETKQLANEKHPTQLEHSCAVIYSFFDDKYSIYGDTEGELNDLRYRINCSDRITTWGGRKFDLPVIFKTEIDRIVGLEAKSDDLRDRVYLSQQLDTGRYDPNQHGEWSLDKVSKATLGCEGKTLGGRGAPALYKQGLWGRLVDYCLNDVKLTRDLVQFSDKHGYLLGKNGLYARVGKDWTKTP
jgi:DEAD/DEAH box helicase domain-containing protein